jgi:hypothetical protein
MQRIRSVRQRIYIVRNRAYSSIMASRPAYAADISVITGDGARRRVPAGACWIDRQSATPHVSTVRWMEQAPDYIAQMSADDLRACVLGCIVQYA